MTTDLPDVNVLIALFTENHIHCDSSHRWLAGAGRFATTPLTESGFLRVMMTRTPTNEPASFDEAVASLKELRSLEAFVFWPDATSLTDHRSITGHVQGPKQITDTHLLNLAIANAGRLVTFDKKIAASLVKRDRRHLLELG